MCVLLKNKDKCKHQIEKISKIGVNKVVCPKKMSRIGTQLTIIQSPIFNTIIEYNI
jgi:hypothetical protein